MFKTMMTINTAKFAASVLVIGGNTGRGGPVPVTEVLGRRDCTGIPTLARYKPVSISTGKLSLVCGGDVSNVHQTSCQQFNAVTKTFTEHSQLVQKRFGSSAIKTSEGIIIVGGEYRGKNVEMLATDSTTWTARTDINGSEVRYSCMTMLNHSHAMMVGGMSSPEEVRLYDVINDQWTDLPSQDVHVWGHDCINTDQGVLVAGGSKGYYKGGVTGQSMLIDPVTGQVETVGSLNDARFEAKLVKIGDSDTIVAVAGSTNAGDRLTSIEEWVPVNKTWIRSNLSLNVARNGFAVLTIPVAASVLCD